MLRHVAEDALRKSLAACNVCNIALVEEVHARSQKGEKVNAICKDLEDFQRQLSGDIYYSWNALKQRYLQAVGLKDRSGSKGTSPTEVMEKLEELARDAGVLAKVESFDAIPPEKPEPEVESVPVVKTTS